ncbi:MAG: hypothetical protein GX786_08150, partial [Clostridiales bacterium]|nr:hypothetical protein [Clostridiales bacterium]
VSLLEDPSATEEAKMTAIALLRDLESLQPMKIYIRWQLTRQEKDDLKDHAVESLKAMGKEALNAIESALDRANEYGQEALLDALIGRRGGNKIFDLVLQFFQEKPEKRAVFADYLGKLGDMRALPVLKEAAMDPQVTYLDYIEIRNAIESLGGDCPERDFEEDEGYEALRQLQ